MSFEIITITECDIFEGYYFTLVDKVKDINLAIATTTFKKEDYIIPNINSIKQECFEQDNEISKNLWIHVVDNGRTLKKEDINHERVYIHQNINAGGSGGYARGMMEVIKQNEIAEDNKKITHVILMDDDILILPEIIKRTYYLLKILKDEYKDYQVAGAMLKLQHKNILYETLGHIPNDGYPRSINPERDYGNIWDIISSAKFEHIAERKYAGWWYCVIPMEYIRKDNLPLPLFIRDDDVEFGLRNKSGYITLNGIAVWHENFAYKYSSLIENYLLHRNNLIIQAVEEKLEAVEYFKILKKTFRKNICRFFYDEAELTISALEDYMKGPEHLMSFNINDVLKVANNKNNEIKTTKGTQYQDVQIHQLINNRRRKFIEKVIYKLTYNGHRLPNAFLSDNKPTIMHNWLESPQKNYLNKTLISINPYNNTYQERNIDKKKFRELIKRYKNIVKLYNKNHERIRQEYKDKKKKMTSYEFWEKYLELKKVIRDGK